MSRGPGQVQKAILEHLRMEPELNSFEAMRWEVYHRLGHPILPAGGALPTKWNTSFRRALDNLAEGAAKRLTLEVRHLSGLDECIRHYPGKTLKVDVYRLRRALLPVLSDWAEGRGPGPRYTMADNERFHLGGLADDALESLQMVWRTIEPKLIERLGSLSLEARNTLFLCLAKGKSLFESMSIQSGKSFVELARECIGEQIVQGDSAEKLDSLCGQFLSVRTAGFLQLKSYVHAFANVPKHRRCRLKDETLEQLYRVQPEVLEVLPGFIPAPKHTSPFHFDRSSPTHSDRVHSLLDQTVFQNFVFAKLIA
jgi:hypothetical protein